MVHYLPVSGAQCVVDSGNHKGTDVAQHVGTPHEHARMLSLD